MKLFDFIKKCPHFQKKSKAHGRTFYVFRNKTTKEVCSFGVPDEPGLDLEWMYQRDERGIEFYSYMSSIDTIETFCPWFYELVREAEASIEKRDKLRRLFI